MSNLDYHSSIRVNVSAKKAYQDISRVSAWWAANLEGKTQNPGDSFTVRFGETFVTFKILEAVADKKIVWKVIDCNLHWLKDKEEWKDTRINWEILAQSNGTEINFTHFGLVPGIECYRDCEKGWNFFVKESLFKLITEGKGLPEFPKVKRQVNN